MILGSPMARFFEKIKKCRFALVDWGHEVFGSFNMQLQAKQKLLEELCLQNNADYISSIKELKADISNLIHQDELFWRQRSQSIWLPIGDKNTKYFHNRASNADKKTISLVYSIARVGGVLRRMVLPRWPNLTSRTCLQQLQQTILKVFYKQLKDVSPHK